MDNYQPNPPNLEEVKQMQSEKLFYGSLKVNLLIVLPIHCIVYRAAASFLHQFFSSFTDVVSNDFVITFHHICETTLRDNTILKLD